MTIRDCYHFIKSINCLKVTYKLNPFSSLRFCVKFDSQNRGDAKYILNIQPLDMRNGQPYYSNPLGKNIKPI